MPYRRRGLVTFLAAVTLAGCTRNVDSAPERAIAEEPLPAAQVAADTDRLLAHAEGVTALLEASGDDAELATQTLGAYLRLSAPGIRRAHERLVRHLDSLAPGACNDEGLRILEALRPTLARMRTVFRVRPALARSEALRETLEEVAWGPAP